MKLYSYLPLPKAVVGEGSGKVDDWMTELRAPYFKGMALVGPIISNLMKITNLLLAIALTSDVAGSKYRLDEPSVSGGNTHRKLTHRAGRSCFYAN